MFCIDEFVGEKKKNVHSMLRNLFIELLLGVVYCACKFLTKRYSAQDYFRTKERNDHTTNAQRSRGGGCTFSTNVKYKYLGNFREISSLKRCYSERNGSNMF